MSSNRLSYDECQHSKRTTERVTPLDYLLFPAKYVPTTTCTQNNELSFTDRVTIENDMLNIDRKTTKCDSGKYAPPCNDPGHCELPGTNFVAARVCDRSVVWTNLVKPTTPGFNPADLDRFK